MKHIERVILWTVILLILFFPKIERTFRFSFTDRDYIGEKEVVTLIFGGDIMLSRHIGRIFFNTDNYRFFWTDIGDIFREADIAFVNLESPISDKGKNVGSIYSFRADPKVIESLLYPGIDVVSFANNHVWDWGRDAFLDTLNRLDEVGILVAGAGIDFEDSHKAKIIERGNIKVGYLAYTNLISYSLRQKSSKPSVAGINLETIKTDIERAREDGADIVVTSFHWGEEYETEHNEYQEEIARKAIDYGGDLVIGHHPHSVQEIEIYNGKIIAYSLGNLIFDQNFSPETSFGILLKVSTNGEELLSAEKIRVDFDSTYVPKVSTIEQVL